MTLKILKALLKQKAAAIRTYRSAFKDAQRKNLGWDAWPKWSDDCCPVSYRLNHIAYCMERGTPYELIEAKVHEGNEPDWKKVDAIRSLIVLEKTVTEVSGDNSPKQDSCGEQP